MSKDLHPEFAPVAFIAAFTLLLPLPWHWRARNVATLSIIAWLFMSNIIYAVDAVVWGDNVRIVGMVWCDITTKLIIGANFALPAACLCLCLHLELVSSSRMGNITLRDKRRRQIFEGCLCWGLPLLLMALHTIVQGHRYDIIEGYGCRPTTYFSIPAIFIVWLPPIVMATACLVLSILSLRNFVIRRLTFAHDLKMKNTGLTTSRYLRLISMAIAQMVWSLVVTCYTLYVTTVGIPLRPWTNWDDVHSDWNRVDVFYAMLTPKKLREVSYVLWWMVPASTILFVLFFSFGQDAVEEYKKCLTWVRTKVLRLPDAPTKLKKGFSFVNMAKASPHVLPISKPVLQSTTSSDYPLPPSYDSTSSQITRVSLSSTTKTETTLHDHTHSQFKDSDGYNYQLPDFKFSNNFMGLQQPKAIGSYSDLSIYSPGLPSPSSTIVPPEPTPKKDDAELPRFPVQARVPVPVYDLEVATPVTPVPARPHPQERYPQPSPEPSVSSRLRPFLLGRGSDSTTRPVTYPSYQAEWWTPQGSASPR